MVESGAASSPHLRTLSCCWYGANNITIFIFLMAFIDANNIVVNVETSEGWVTLFF